MENDGCCTKRNFMKRKAFTLIELLIVLVIIGMLMGLLLPALRKARLRAKETKAKDAVTQLTIAWQSYLAEYRMFPSDNDNPSMPVPISEMNVTAVKILKGETYNNMGKHEFLEFTTNEVQNGFMDPWGTLYQVALDNGAGNDTTGPYDGKVKVPHQGVALDRSVAAWSKGADKMSSSGDTLNDDVKSWK